MKLPDYGGPGPRAPRSLGLAEAASGISSPVSRAQIANGQIYNTAQSPGNVVGGTGSSTQPSTSSSGSGSGNGTPAPGEPGGPPPQYDLSADPVLQQVQAAVTLDNQQAKSAELNAEDQALLAYGDPALTAKILGAKDPMVAAAGGNQESTLALLRRGYHQGLQQFDDTLDPSLLFSGARIKGEGLLGQTYQDDLARAAAGIQSQLSGITGSYDSAVQGNEDKLLQALADAYSRALQNALVNPPAGPGNSPTPKTKPKTKSHGHAPVGSLAAAAAAGDLPAIIAALHGGAGGL